MARRLISILLVLALCFCLLPARQAGWYVPGTSPTMQKLKDVKVLDANTVVAVGENGSIVRTTNGGTTWTLAASGTSVTLTALQFANATTGWAVGYDRTICKTTDAGATWTNQFSTMSSRHIYDVYFADALTGWTVGRDDWSGYIAHVYKTTNGGTSWSLTMMGTSSNLYSISFVSSSVGCAVGSGGSIRKTTDGGSSWSGKTSGTTNALYSVTFADAQTGFAAGLNGTIIKTTDAGETWSSLTSGTTQGLYAIDFAGPLNGWAVGANGTILTTTDGGVTWRAQTSGTSETLYGTDFTDSQKGWAVGGSGRILKTTSGGDITNDVGVTSLDVADVADRGEAVSVKIAIKNYGSASQSNFPVSYSVNSGSPITETFSGTLLPGATGTKTFAATWSNSIEGEYQFTARTQLSGDENSTNDAAPASRTVVVVGLPTYPADPSGWFALSVQSSGVTNYNDIHVFNAARAIAVGSNGSIMKTADGGSTWQKLISGVTAALRGVSFIDSQTGWICGDNGTLLKTTNGGSSWSPLNSGTTKALRTIQFVDANTGWINEDYDNLRKTTDGGNSWVVKYAYTGNGALEHLRFVSPTTGVIAGRFDGGYALYRTTDGGNTWSNPTLYNGWIKCVHFTDALNGWASGLTGIFSYTVDVWGDAYWSVSSAQSTFWKTTDAGATWSVGTISGTNWLNGVRFVDAATGWMYDSQKRILRTTDGGASWLVLSGVTSNTMRSFGASSATSAWIVGDNNTILKTSDGGVTWNSRTTATTTNWLQSVTFVDDDRGWVAGYAGTIMRTTNGGRSWSAPSSSTSQNLMSIAFSTAQGGWAVGGGGTMLRSSDGGATWVPHASGTLNDLNAVVFSSSVNGWCVGSFGLMLRTTNGGSTWSSQTIGSTSLFGLSFVTDMTGWAVGVGGTVQKTTDGGNVWTQQTSGTSERLCSVDFVDAQTGWAVGHSGVIVKTTNGGTTWTRQESRTDRYLYSVHFVTSDIGWVAGDRVILKTTNGGNTWGIQTTGVTGTLSGVWARSPSLVWAVGTNGTIIKTSDGGGAISFPPATPVLVLPADYTTKVPRAVTLSWNRASEATSYRLQVSKAGSFSSTIVDQASITDTSYSLSGLDYGTLYYWRVSSTNAIGTSAWSVSRSFKTEAAPLPPATLSSPVNGAGDLETVLTMHWSFSVQVPDSRLQVARDSAFSSPLFIDTTIAATTFTFSGFEQGVTYFWRVRGSSSESVGDWSAIWRFTTKKTVAPPAPSLRSPPNLATELPTTVNFQWNQVAGVVMYRLQVSTVSHFTTVVFDGTAADTSRSVNGLQFDKLYYWRVQAIDAAGAGTWSTAWSFSTMGSAGSWKETSVSGFNRSIAFVGARYGWIVGWNGITATTNGGVSWESQMGGNVRFESVCFVDSLVGWVVGNGSTILKTTNGGSLWAAQTGGTVADFRGVSMSDANNGWVVAEKTILRTTNGGSSWQPQIAPSMNFIYGVKALSSTRGIVYGGNPLLRTTDGGATWASSSLPEYGFLQDAYFLTENIGWVVGADGVMFRTTDGGVQWAIVSTGTLDWLTGIHFVDSQLGWAVGWNGLILHTTDGGVTWGRQISGTTSSFYGLYFTGPLSGWAIGGANRRTIDGGGKMFFPPVLSTPSNNASNIPINPTFRWEASEGIVSYQLQVATGSYFYSGSIVVNDSALTSTSRQSVTLSGNRTYYWRVLGYLSDGTILVSPLWKFTTGSSATPVEYAVEVPETFNLQQNYPNPFNPSTTIQFDVPKSGSVTLKVYSALGSEVATLVASHFQPGRYAIVWNAAHLPSGVYFCRMQANPVVGGQGNNYVQVRKLLLLK